MHKPTLSVQAGIVISGSSQAAALKFLRLVECDPLRYKRFFAAMRLCKTHHILHAISIDPCSAAHRAPAWKPMETQDCQEASNSPETTAEASKTLLRKSPSLLAESLVLSGCRQRFCEGQRQDWRRATVHISCRWSGRQEQRPAFANVYEETRGREATGAQSNLSRSADSLDVLLHWQHSRVQHHHGMHEVVIKVDLAPPFQLERPPNSEKGGASCQILNSNRRPRSTKEGVVVKGASRQLASGSQVVVLGSE